jgi:glycosyltransferase involved in cell wall biosynthesis
MVTSSPLPPREGIGFYAWNLADFLTQQGHKVTIITRGGMKHHEEANINGITIVFLPFLPIYPIHVNFHGIFLNQYLNKFEREFELVHLHSPLVPIPKTNLPIFATIHTPISADSAAIRINNIQSLLVKAQIPFSRNIERKLLYGANKIVTVAQSVRDELEQYGFGTNSIDVLENGVDTNLFSPLLISEPKSKERTRYFFTAGRLGLRKGLEDLINAAIIVKKKESNIQFWIAGEGPLKNEISLKIKSQGLSETIKLLGQIQSRSELAELYRNAIAYIHPAHYEGMATVILEAMSCGAAVISTAVSGALDLIEDRVNGMLVSTHNPEGLANAASELMDDPLTASYYGSKARQTIMERYSWDIVGRNYINEYERLLG